MTWQTCIPVLELKNGEVLSLEKELNLAKFRFKNLKLIRFSKHFCIFEKTFLILGLMYFGSTTLLVERFYHNAITPTHLKKTREKILKNAIKLFNKQGVSNVRLQDIAKEAGISAGNLSYHYKLKKDLIEAVLDYMVQSSKEMSGQNMAHVEKNDYTAVIKNYLSFQIHHRFFYRDILEISSFAPNAKKLFEQQMEQVINFTKNGMYLAIGKGFIKPEPHDGHYHFFAKNTWAILNSWLVEREILGEKKVSMHQVMLAIWEFHYPYFTEKGLEVFEELKGQLPMLIEKELVP